MIQRKQTLFLLFASLLSAVTLIFPLITITFGAPDVASTVGVSDSGVYNVWGFEYANGTSDPFIYHGILAILATVLPIITIFLYKRRFLQLRLTIVEGVFVLGLAAFEAFGAYRISAITSTPGYVVDFNTTVMLAPVAAVLFVFMAYKGILKDIIILRNYDRIR